MNSMARRIEDQFFYKMDQDLLREQKALMQMEKTKKEIKEVSGIHDEGVLLKLVALNIRPETVVSLALIPLVEVAWANGSIGKKEKAATLTAVNRLGWAKESIDYTLLERWLEHKPDLSLLRAWIDYVGHICTKMNGDEITKLKTEIMSNARMIANVSGGILGIGNISRQEKEILMIIENAFVTANGGE